MSENSDLNNLVVFFKYFPANEQQPSRVFYPSKEAAPMNKLNSSEVLVKHEISVQRLPRGQNLVSVTRPGKFLFF